MALVPFALHVETLDPGPAGARAAVLGGLLLGGAYFGVLLYWIAVALLWMSPLAVPAYLGVVAVLAALVGLAAWALHRIRHRLKTPLWLALPLTWTAAEWLRGHLPGELAFPWLGLGTSLTGFPEIVGVAEIIGARGITFWLVLVSGLLAEAVRRGGRKGRWRAPVGAALLVVAFPAGWGIWRAGTLETRSVARVAVVQPNVQAALRSGPDGGLAATRAALADLMPRTAGRGTDLVVWPEAAFLRAFPESGSAPLLREVRAHAATAGAPILLGAHGESRAEDSTLERHNSAFLVGREGVRDYAYHKQRLVPVVERLPFVEPDRSGRFGGYGGLSPGRGSPLGRTTSGANFGVLICYESAFPELARRYRRAGADFLVNMTNDAWFGRQAWHARTPALWQHPAHLVMRAIETRTGVARAANTGISLFVDPVGRIEGRTPLFEPAVRVAEVRTTDVLTLYVRLGDWVGIGSAAGTLILLLAAGVGVGGTGSSARPSTRSGGCGS